MSRQRVRRSFTVEVKSGARQGSASDIPNRLTAAAEPTPRSPVWPWDAAPASSPQTPAPAATERRRILPSLLPTQALEAEPEPEPIEEPLPRVRRVAMPATGEPPRKRGRPRKIPLAEMPASNGEVFEAPVAVEAIPDVPELRGVPAEGASRPRTTGRAEEQVLRRGERWKRRLPRACW